MVDQRARRQETLSLKRLPVLLELGRGRGTLGMLIGLRSWRLSIVLLVAYFPISGLP